MSKAFTTSQQTTEFANYAAVWQGVLNLGDWRIEMSTTPADATAMAQVDINLPGRLATLFFGDSTSVGYRVDDDHVHQIALHEMLHVFLADLIGAARRPNATDDEVLSQEHRIIHVLLPLLLELPRKG